MVSQRKKIRNVKSKFGSSKKTCSGRKKLFGQQGKTQAKKNRFSKKKHSQQQKTGLQKKKYILDAAGKSCIQQQGKNGQRQEKTCSKKAHTPQKQYFQYQRYELRPLYTASGHAPCSASGGKNRTQQNLRSESFLSRWASSFAPSLQTVENSHARYCEPHPGAIPPLRKGCKLVFERQLTLHTWNVETRLGTGKYEMFAAVLNTIQIGAVCLQETKKHLHWSYSLFKLALLFCLWMRMTHMQELDLQSFKVCSHWCTISSRSRCGLLSWSLPQNLSRSPCFPLMPPSQVSCQQEDLDRKEAFWRSLHEWYMHFSPHSYPIGDFNMRLYAHQLEGLDRHIGPVTFSPPTEPDLAHNNFTYMLQFLVQNDLCIISSMRPRPLHINHLSRNFWLDYDYDPTRPAVGNFAVLDHVVTPFQYRTFFRSIWSVPSLPLPWFHRHYLLTATFVAPDFVHKDPPAAPPAFLPPSTSQKHEFQSVVLQYFWESSSLANPRSAPNPCLILFISILTAHAQVSITSAPITLLAGASTLPTHTT